MNTPNTNVKLTKRQAERLSSLSGVPAKELLKGKIAELAERYKLIFDPRWLLFERVCGRVVKTDPATGIDYPVPYATVHIQDNDCSFIGFFPTGSQWSWFYPFWCNREDIGVTTTDAVGTFVPGFCASTSTGFWNGGVNASVSLISLSGPPSATS